MSSINAGTDAHWAEVRERARQRREDVLTKDHVALFLDEAGKIAHGMIYESWVANVAGCARRHGHSMVQELGAEGAEAVRVTQNFLSHCSTAFGLPEITGDINEIDKEAGEAVSEAWENLYGFPDGTDEDDDGHDPADFVLNLDDIYPAEPVNIISSDGRHLCVTVRVIDGAEDLEILSAQISTHNQGPAMSSDMRACTAEELSALREDTAIIAVIGKALSMWQPEAVADRGLLEL